MNANRTIGTRTGSARRLFLEAVAVLGLGLTGCDKDQVESLAAQLAGAVLSSEEIANGQHPDEADTVYARLKLTANHNETILAQE